MNRLLPAHKKIFSVVLLIGGVCLVFWFLVLHQMQAHLVSLKRQIHDTRTDLIGRGFPVNPAQLNRLKMDLDAQRSRIWQKYDKVYDVAMQEFKDQIALYNSVQAYQKSISQLDYQEKFLAIKRELADVGIALDEKILGLSETSSSDRNYQLYSQLLVVKKIAMLAKDNHLSFAKTNKKKTDDESKQAASAKIAIKKVIRYATEQDQNPFVEEYPVQFAVIGKLGDFSNFLFCLTRPPHFIPVTRVSVRKIDCDHFHRELIEGVVSCSAFLLLRDKSDTRPPDMKKTTNWHPGI